MILMEMTRRRTLISTTELNYSHQMLIAQTQVEEERKGKMEYGQEWELVRTDERTAWMEMILMDNNKFIRLI